MGSPLPTPMSTPPPSSPLAQPQATDQITSAGAVASNVNMQEKTSTTISSMADLKNKAPKIYKFMMLSIAQNMCIQMKQSNDRLVEEMKKMRDDHNS